MPKTLNIPKLENKFATLTKARESIQSLSQWIIHHKQFYTEIVQEWLKALKRSDIYSVITVFYVANDVIQHCERKGAPEFREAFSSVLKQAVALENVKIYMKENAIRMISLWNDRGIYSDEFSQQLRTILESSPLTNSEDDDAVEIVKETDDSDLEDSSEIINTYKVQDLIESLGMFEMLQKELVAKEADVNYFKQPEEPNYDQLIVRMDGRHIYRKYEKYNHILNEYIQLAGKMISARKNVLKHLKHSNTFYTVQHSEVKKVAQAYKLYGKKLKNLEDKLAEKKIALDPPLQEENYSANSPDCISLLPNVPVSEPHLTDQEKNSNAAECPSKVSGSPTSDASNQGLTAINVVENNGALSSSEKAAIQITKKETNWFELLKSIRENCNLKLSQIEDNIVPDIKDNSLPQINRTCIIEPQLELAARESHNLSTSAQVIATKSSDYMDEVDILLEGGFSSKSVKKNAGIKRKIASLFKADKERSKRATSSSMTSESISKCNEDASITAKRDVGKEDIKSFQSNLDVLLPLVKKISDSFSATCIPGFDSNSLSEEISNESPSIPGSFSPTVTSLNVKSENIKTLQVETNQFEPNSLVEISSQFPEKEKQANVVSETDKISNRFLEKEAKANIAPESNRTINTSDTSEPILNNIDISISLLEKILGNDKIRSVVNNDSSNEQNSETFQTKSKDSSQTDDSSSSAIPNDEEKKVVKEDETCKLKDTVINKPSKLLQAVKTVTEYLSRPKLRSREEEIEINPSGKKINFPAMPLNSLFKVLSCVLQPRSSGTSISSGGFPSPIHSKVTNSYKPEKCTSPPKPLHLFSDTDQTRDDISEQNFNQPLSFSSFFNTDMSACLQEVISSASAETVGTNMTEQSAEPNSSNCQNLNKQSNCDSTCNLEVTDMDVDDSND